MTECKRFVKKTARRSKRRREISCVSVLILKIRRFCSVGLRIMKNKQFYRIRLTDYARPGFSSGWKDYYGTQEEIEELIIAIRNNKSIDNDVDGLYAALTEFKSGNKTCEHTAAGYKELKGKTPKEMFKRHGDDRDGGMSLLDENSQDDFDKWFKLSTQEKWEIENPSHMWEISCGHTHTMIHLYLFWDDGYWFYLSGGTHCLTTEVVRMYNAMKDKGVPVLLGHAGQIADKLLGNDDLGIIPNNDMGWRYWYGGFPKDDVINFVQLSDGNAEAVIKNATWFDIADVKLSDK